jgi:hypothetical protein
MLSLNTDVLEVLGIAVLFGVLGTCVAAGAERTKIRALFSNPNPQRVLGYFITIVGFSFCGCILGATAGVVAVAVIPSTLDFFMVARTHQEGIRAAALFSYSGLITYIVAGNAIESMFQSNCRAESGRHPECPPDDPENGPPIGPWKGA